MINFIIHVSKLNNFGFGALGQINLNNLKTCSWVLGHFLSISRFSMKIWFQNKVLDADLFRFKVATHRMRAAALHLHLHSDISHHSQRYWHDLGLVEKERKQNSDLKLTVTSRQINVPTPSPKMFPRLSTFFFYISCVFCPRGGTLVLRTSPRRPKMEAKTRNS